MELWKKFNYWCLLLTGTAIMTAICMRWFDIPVAMFFQVSAHHINAIGRGLSSIVLVSGEAVLLLVLAVTRLVSGRLSSLAKAVFVACCASLTAFVVNDYVLKFVFGRQNPSVFFQSAKPDTFSFFQGDPHGSFPSGHMVIATAFAMVIFRLQPRYFPVLAILLVIGAVGLLAGDWHFLSDVVAGAFVGATVGSLAGELWAMHVRDHAAT